MPALPIIIMHMPKNINHEERKQLIILTALKVFATRGYKETNLTLVAQECNLARTTVYQYFSSVDDILVYAVKKVMDTLFEKYNSPKWQEDSSPFTLIQRICNDIFDQIDLHSDELSNFLLSMRDIDIDLRGSVHRRTAKLNLLLSRLVRAAQSAGEMKKCSAHDCVSKLLILIESYCFHLVFFEEQTTLVRELLEGYLDSLSVKQEQL